MFNKDTCRFCGVCLVRIALRNTCTQYVSGVCNNCDEMEEVYHSHCLSKIMKEFVLK